MAPTSSRNKKDKTAGSASEEKVKKSGKRTTRAAAPVSGRRTSTRQQKKKVGETDSDTEDFEDQIIKSDRSTTADRQRNRSTPDTSSNLSNGAVKKVFWGVQFIF